MFIISLAAFASFVALVSGIVAVGSGAKWKYTFRDMLRGKRNAMLYIWVTFSTIFSLVHTVANLNYLLEPINGMSFEVQIWFAIHFSAAVLLVAAHIFIYNSLDEVPLMMKENISELCTKYGEGSG